LSLVYDELRKLAAQKLTQEKPGQTLQATLDDALVRLADLDPLAGELVKLRYFAGISLVQAAASLGISEATAYRHWAYARAWLRSDLLKES
jgi:DNA-directed RNA polymerase specialized sigma24 family protein